MDAGKRLLRRMHDHERDLQSKRRALADAAAGHFDRAAMHLGQLAGNRQAQAETAPFARDPRVGLPKTLEHVRKELRRDPDTRVADAHFHVRVDPLEPHLNSAATVGELDRVRQQVPQHLLQPFRIARDGRRLRIQDRLDPHALRLRGRGDGVDRAPHDFGELHGLNVQSNLARHDPGDVEHVLDDLRQGRGVPLDGRDRLLLLVRGDHAGPKHPRVAQNRIQRRPQLMREARQKVVLDAARLLRVHIQARVLERDRRPRRDANREALVMLGEAVDRRVAEEQPANHLA